MTPQQPVYLTTEDANPNGATVRFLVDGAEAAEHAGYERIVYLFDGHDAGAVARAREQWKAAKEAGCEVTYWQQSRGGRARLGSTAPACAVGQLARNTQPRLPDPPDRRVRGPA